MRTFVGLLIATIGCANTPPALFNEPVIRVTEVETEGVRVFAPTFELDFAASNLRLPEHLIVNHVDVLGADDPCAGESRVGLAVTPAIQASAGGSAGRSVSTVLARGPAMAKVSVSYEISYTCPGSERMTGTTEFTIFPSGRIIREDIQVSPSSDTLTITGRCGCRSETDVSPKEFVFSSYWAFDPTGATQVDNNGNAVDKIAADQLYRACTKYNQHAIGVAWLVEDMVPKPSARFHGHRTASHRLDFPPSVSDRMMLAPDRKSVRSAIQISVAPLAQGSDCEAVLAALADVPLTIGSTVFEKTSHDGIYRDDAIHNTPFDVVAGDVAVPAGFAISVDLGGANHAAISHDQAGSPVATVQRELGNRFVIVFRDGLAPGERLTIEPRR